MYDELEEEFEEIEDFEDELEEEAEDLPSLVREDKIFNNRYNTGEGLTDTDEYQFTRKISVAGDYSDSYLRDLYEYEENLENKYILEDIFSFIKEDHELSKIIIDGSSLQTKVKFSKEQVNLIFNKINDEFSRRAHSSSFYSPIYVLEVISSVSLMEYKKIFDLFEADVQEILILELNKKYLFLEGRSHKKRIH